jgi:hypothetical protein
MHYHVRGGHEALHFLYVQYESGLHETLHGVDVAQPTPMEQRRPSVEM